MEKKTPKEIFQNALEKELPPGGPELWPHVQERLVARKHPLYQQGEKMKPNYLRRAAFAALTLFLTLGILLSTPQGRAFAQELLGYFFTTTQWTYPYPPTPNPVATYTLDAPLAPQAALPIISRDCGSVVSSVASTFLCQLQNAQVKLGFPVKSLPASHVKVPFNIMLLDEKQRKLTLNFHSPQMEMDYSLEQGWGDFPQTDSPGDAIRKDAIEQVQVNGHPAEFARGTFVLEENHDKTRTWVWRPTESVYRLRWKEGERWFSFVVAAFHPAEPTTAEMRTKMIEIAENLVGLEQGQGALAAGDQPSLQEQIGFPIRVPGLLPEGFEQVPDGSWSSMTSEPRIGLRYAYKVDGEWANTLVLYQMRIPKDGQTLLREFAILYQDQNPENPTVENPGEQVQINNLSGFYLEAAGHFASAVYWRDSEKEYLLLYQWMPTFGGRLDKATLIEIAESLK